MSRWLLLEQPGGWGRNALQSRADVLPARGLTAAAAAAGVRIVLIRRPGRSPDVAAPARAWAHVDSRPGHEAVRWGTYAGLGDLGDVLSGSAGRPADDPVYLVCAHGRRDACCAIRGRPVAAALARLRPDQVWECSHIGGDRFAANVVVLPEGLYYGHVTAEAVPDLLAAHDAGQVLGPLLRGRSALPAPVQAAEHHARLLLDERRIAALPLLRVDSVDRRTWRVVLAHEGREVSVSVRAESAPPVRLTCSSDRLESVRVFRLVDFSAAAG